MTESTKKVMLWVYGAVSSFLVSYWIGTTQYDRGYSAGITKAREILLDTIVRDTYKPKAESASQE